MEMAVSRTTAVVKLSWQLMLSGHRQQACSSHSAVLSLMGYTGKYLKKVTQPGFVCLLVRCCLFFFFYFFFIVMFCFSIVVWKTARECNHNNIDTSFHTIINGNGSIFSSSIATNDVTRLLWCNFPLFFIF